jgi:tetratricopeptide (TPR) repeat protein
MRRPIITILAVSMISAAGCAGWLYLRPHDKLAEARQLMAKGQMRAAELVLRGILQTDPDSAEARVQLGRAQLRLGDAAAAEKDFRAARDLGWDARALTPLLAQAVAAQGRYDEVLRDYSPDKLPPDQAAMTLVARAVAQMALKRPEEATAAMTEAQRLAPNSLDVALAAARLATARNDSAGALADIDAALKIDPHAMEALMLQAAVRAGDHDNQGALTSYSAAIEQAQSTGAPDTQTVIVRLGRAGLLLSMNDEAGARTDIASVLKLQPRNPLANFMYARLLARSGDWKAADTALTAVGPVLRRLPGGDPLLAVVKINLNEPEQALAAAERQVARTPGDLRAVKLLARLELMEKRPDAAARVLAAATVPLDSEGLDLLGRAYTADGRRDKALDTLKQASALRPDDTVVLTRLAALELAQGEASQAVQVLDRALDLTTSADRVAVPVAARPAGATTMAAVSPPAPGNLVPDQNAVAGAKPPVTRTDAPSQAQAASALVRAALQAGEIDRASVALDRLRDAKTDPDTVALLTGAVKLAQIDLAGAQAAFQEAHALSPQAAEPRINLARVLALQGHGAEAITMLQGVMTDDPANGAALTTLVDLLLQTKQQDKAIAAAEAAQRNAPANIGITVGLAGLYLRTNQPDKTLALVDATEKAGAAQPGNTAGKLSPALLDLRAQAQASLGQRAAAEQSLGALLNMAPTNVVLRRQLAEMKAADKDYDGARAVLRDGLNRSPGDAALLAAQVAVAGREGGPAAAVTRANELARDPLNAAPWLAGDVLMSQNKFAEAANNYQAKLASLASDDAQADILAVRAADAINAGGNPARSASMLRDRLATHPDSIPLMLALSELDIVAGRMPQARTGLEGVLARQPNNPAALNNLAWLDQQQGDLTTARAMAQRAYILVPSPQSADTLGWIVLQQGQVPSAVALLREAGNAKPQDPGIHYHLAAALAKDGQKDEAVAMLKTVMVAPMAGFADRPQAAKLLGDLSAH